MYSRNPFIALAALAASVLAADPQLVYVGDIQFNLGSTIPAGQTPLGQFVYVDIASGWFNTTSNYTAPGSEATGSAQLAVLPGGHDYARIRTDNSTEIEVAIAFRGTGSESSNLFWLTSYGYVAPDAFTPGTYMTQYGQFDNYQVIKINTNSTAYGWMNAALLVSQERLTVVDSATTTVEQKVFRVVINP